MHPELRTASTSNSLSTRSSDPITYSRLQNSSPYNPDLQTKSYEAQSVSPTSQVTSTNILTFSNSPITLSTLDTGVQTQSSQMNALSSTYLKSSHQSLPQTANTSRSLTSLSIISSNPSANSELYSTSSNTQSNQSSQTASTEARSFFPTSNTSNLTAMTNGNFSKLFSIVRHITSSVVRIFHRCPNTICLRTGYLIVTVNRSKVDLNSNYAFYICIALNNFAKFCWIDFIQYQHK